jgi:hopene-associated glycosyltransferase HpnB
MTSWLLLPAAATAAAWLYLLLFHGGFWRCSERLRPSADDVARPASVAVLIPARNEADSIGATLASLAAQHYGGRLELFLVDDVSTDGTAERARVAAGARLTVIEGRPLPPGWSGKLWAQSQGLDAILRSALPFDYVLLCDADITHGPDVVSRLVGLAERDGLDLASLMVQLNCQTRWERLLIPPFIFFFQKLYPFPRVKDPASRTAAAAGGCMLLRRSALERIGGFAAIRTALIDDCALAAAVKRSGGRIWLGLAEDSRSVRRYDRLAPVWDMVARSAYTQLHRSPLLLLGTVAGMLLLYLLAPALLLTVPWHGDLAAAATAALACALMASAYWPTLRTYRQPWWMIPTLPHAALLYTAMTVDSALRHWRGRGGQWKGRTYSDLADGAVETRP